MRQGWQTHNSEKSDLDTFEGPVYVFFMLRTLPNPKYHGKLRSSKRFRVQGLGFRAYGFYAVLNTLRLWPKPEA